MGIAETVRDTITKLLADNNFRCTAQLVPETKTSTYGGYDGSVVTGGATNFNCIPTRMSDVAVHDNTGQIVGGGVSLIIPYTLSITQGNLVTYNSIDYTVEEVRDFYLGNDTDATSDNKNMLRILRLSRRF